MPFNLYNPSPDEVKESQKHCNDKHHFGMRITQELSTLYPEGAKAFANFYESVFKDAAIKGYIKELMFVSIGVSHCSPACLIHVIGAINLGATDDEIFEAVNVGTAAAGMVPKGPGIPYAFQYAKKVLEIAAKYRSGEKWEYLTPPTYHMD